MIRATKLKGTKIKNLSNYIERVLQNMVIKHGDKVLGASVQGLCIGLTMSETLL